MSKTLSTKKALFCSIIPKYLNNKETDKEQIINSLIEYSIDLFNGIQKNPDNSFDGNFEFVIDAKLSNILVYRNSKKKSIDCKDVYNFLTFISIMQMTFIDEQIYLKGIVSIGDALVTKHSFLCKKYEQVTNECNNLNFPLIYLDLDESCCDDTFIIINDKKFLDFIPMVYKHNPFKDEYGNMQRHIIEPTNKILKSNTVFLSEFSSYVNSYCDLHGYSHKIKN